MAAKPRDYKKEAKYHATPKQKKDRAARNAAARNKKCGPNKTVSHLDGDPRNNAPGNLSCISQAANNRLKKGKKYKKAKSRR